VLSANVQGSATIFNAVFFVALVSTLAQGMTLEPFARRLGLATEEKPYDRRAKERSARPIP
jgi:NhaP-type Na+/H+ and K+/H+ antiporter